MKQVFTPSVYKIFDIDGLDERMAAIRAEIQPVFQAIGDEFQLDVNDQLNMHGVFHIAQHARRTKNPPSSTWCAMGGDSRGYKKYPHLQVQVNGDYIFVGLALIDNPNFEAEMIHDLLVNRLTWQGLPEDVVLIPDHTKEAYKPFTEETMEHVLQRVLDVKKGEIMIGRVIEPGSDLLEDATEQTAFIKASIDLILPLYAQTLQTYRRAEEKK